jgi:hypothetical protein
MPLYQALDATSAQGPITITASSYQLDLNIVYIIDTNSRCLLSLPLSAPVGSFVNIVNRGSGGWRIMQNANQSIKGGSDSTLGTAGYIESQTSGDSVFLRCVNADTDFKINSQRGTLTIV